MLFSTFVAAACFMVSTSLADDLRSISGHAYMAASHTADEIFTCDKSGKIVRTLKIEHPQDFRLLENGNMLVTYLRGVKEISRDGKTLWEYNVEAPCEIPAAQLLPDGKVLIGITGQCRLVELENGKETKSIQLYTPIKKPHQQFRYCRKTPECTYIVPFTDEGAVREYDGTGNVLRTFPKGAYPAGVIRMPNGNTIISIDRKIVEFDSKNRVVWELKPEDIPEINMAYPAGIQKLPNGNIIVCNWDTKDEAGKRGAHIFEITPDKRVVWEVESREFGQIAQCQLLTDDLKPRKDILR